MIDGVTLIFHLVSKRLSAVSQHNKEGRTLMVIVIYGNGMIVGNLKGMSPSGRTSVRISPN
jgi:hypothetical protein